MSNKFYIVRTDDAKDLPLPSYQTEQSAGMDLYASVKDTTIIKPGSFLPVPTGIKLALPVGFEAQIRPRSGIAAKHGVTMVNAPGTIDADYRGEIHVILINHGTEDFIVNRGDRIAQMVVARVEQITWTQAKDLDETARGNGGFGSTGR